jgi:hypothetical protein
MKNIKLRLFEYYGLSVELNGNEQTKGLLQENLSLVLKYHLTNLAKKVAEELEVVEKIKLELAQRYGKQNEDGSWMVEMYVDQTQQEVSQNYVSFTSEFNTLLNEEKELQYSPIKLSLLEDIKSDLNFPTVFKMVVE